jgi:hypothetical protein
MALYFSETVAAALAGETIGLAVLGRFSFVEGERRLWLGQGRITAGGETWDGLGEFVSMSSLSSGAGDVAAPVTFSLSGVDEEIHALAVAGGQTVRGRAVAISLQFYNHAMVALDSPVVFWTGKMDRITAEGDLQSRSVSLICEGLFTNRSKPVAGLLSDRDQQARFPGDKGLQFVNSLIYKAVKWPAF